MMGLTIPTTAMRFLPQNPDYELSPFTGLGWQHWVDAGKLLLDGVFRHIADYDTSLRLPRHEHSITYPQPGHPEWKVRSEVFEGVARTLLIAAPLLAHFPKLQSNGLVLGKYYRKAILRLADRCSSDYMGDIESIVAEFGDNPFQMTCECASLVIALRTAAPVLWDPLDPKEKDAVASLLSAWAHRKTHPHNWRLFNILTLAFLQDHGYPIDEELYQEHLRIVRSFDAGDGWYRDGTLFDYYSVWAFQFYAPLWAHSSGYRTHPQMAKAIEQSAHALLKTYDRIFDRSGHQIMWGRSNIYRFAASAPFGSAFLMKTPGVDPGLARRVMSGNLMQFLGHPDFWRDGLPSIGFYGPFPPLIQPYSCAASPFWFGNAYHAVALGPNHPLWTARETAGSWQDVQPGKVVETELSGPGMVISQYGNSGASEIRTGKVMIAPKSTLLAHYSRLSFNSALPWQADTSAGYAAMHYNFALDGKFLRPNLILYAGVRNGVLHRRLIYGFEGAFGDAPAIDLADFAVADGLLRCDRLRVAHPDTQQSLAHYALPIRDGQCRIEMREPRPGIRAITAASGNLQLALVVLHGWDQLEAVRETRLHPDAPESVLLVAHSSRLPRYGGEPLRIALLLHRIGDAPWSDADLTPFDSFEILDDTPSGSSPAVRFTLADGRIQCCEFVEIEGRLQI